MTEPTPDTYADCGDTCQQCGFDELRWLRFVKRVVCPECAAVHEPQHECDSYGPGECWDYLDIVHEGPLMANGDFMSRDGGGLGLIGWTP